MQICIHFGDSRGFHEALNAGYDPNYQDNGTLCSSNGETLIVKKAAMLSRWSEHFQALFNTN